MKDIYKSLFLFFGVIAIICFIILVSPSSRVQKGKVFFRTGNMIEEYSSKSRSNLPRVEKCKNAVSQMNIEIQNSLKQYYKEQCSAFPFSIQIKYLKEKHACLEYDARGKGITSMIDYLLRDAVENRILFSVDKEIGTRDEIAYSGGYSRDLDWTLIAHFSGYIGIFSVIIMMYCWIKGKTTFFE